MICNDRNEFYTCNIPFRRRNRDRLTVAGQANDRFPDRCRLHRRLCSKVSMGCSSLSFHAIDCAGCDGDAATKPVNYSYSGRFSCDLHRRRGSMRTTAVLVAVVVETVATMISSAAMSIEYPSVRRA